MITIFKDLNINYLRCWNFSYAWTDDDVKQVLDLLHGNGIKATIVLSTRLAYPFIKGYPNDLALSKSDAKAFIDTHGSHPAIIAWDVMNEPRFDLELGSLEWTREMLQYVKSLVGDKQFVYAGIGGTSVLKNELEMITPYEDVCAVHYYLVRGNPEYYSADYVKANLANDFTNFMASVQAQNPNNLPIWLDEWGAKSEPPGAYNGYTDLEGQRETYAQMFQQMPKYNFPTIAFWQGNTNVGWCPYTPTYEYKPAAFLVRDNFTPKLSIIPAIIVALGSLALLFLGWKKGWW